MKSYQYWTNYRKLEAKCHYQEMEDDCPDGKYKLKRNQRTASTQTPHSKSTQTPITEKHSVYHTQRYCIKAVYVILCIKECNYASTFKIIIDIGFNFSSRIAHIYPKRQWPTITQVTHPPLYAGEGK